MNRLGLVWGSNGMDLFYSKGYLKGFAGAIDISYTGYFPYDRSLTTFDVLGFEQGINVDPGPVGFNLGYQDNARTLEGSHYWSASMSLGVGVPGAASYESYTFIIDFVPTFFGVFLPIIIKQ